MANNLWLTINFQMRISELYPFLSLKLDIRTSKAVWHHSLSFTLSFLNRDNFIVKPKPFTTPNQLDLSILETDEINKRIKIRCCDDVLSSDSLAVPILPTSSCGLFLKVGRDVYLTCIRSYKNRCRVIKLWFNFTKTEKM